MNHFEISEQIKSIEKILQKASRLENQYNNGRNKKIKKNAYQDLKMEIDLFERRINMGEFPLDLFVPNIINPMVRSEIYDDFFSVGHFTEELKNAIENLKARLK